jgi:HlyD family secretion protein
MQTILAWIMGVLAAVIPGLAPPGPPSWNGYVEADYTYAAAASAGTIVRIAVAEGQSVKAGDMLFVLDASQQQAQYDAAEARAQSALATLQNLQTGSRQDEVDVAQASLDKARSDLNLANTNLARTQDLYDRGLTPISQLDASKAAAQAAQATVDQLQAQLKVAQLPARDAQQIAADATYKAAEADAETAKVALDQRTVTAPAAGRVERLFYKVGEVAGAGVPVLSIQGGDALKIEFYVNQADREQFALGQQVSVTCDGCPAGLTATVSHFASDPQFTPPIIYSRDERQRLVFLTEATMDNQNGILPGQPVSVELGHG